LGDERAAIALEVAGADVERDLRSKQRRHLANQGGMHALPRHSARTQLATSVCAASGEAGVGMGSM